MAKGVLRTNFAASDVTQIREGIKQLEQLCKKLKTLTFSEEVGRKLFSFMSKWTKIMVHRPVTTPPCVLDTCEPALFASMGDIESFELEDSEIEDNKSRQDELLNGDNNPVVCLATSLSTLDASTSSSKNAVGDRMTYC